MNRLKSLMAAAAVLTMATARTQAVVVNFSVPEESETIALTNGLNASVLLNQNSDSVDLTPGVADTVLLSGGSVTLHQPSTSTGSGTLTRPLTVSSGSATPAAQSISQGISISQDQGSPPFVPASADVFIGAGSAVTYNLGGYELKVTPIASSRVDQESGTFPISNSAEFLLTVVPEPTGGLFVLAGAGLLAATRRRRA